MSVALGSPAGVAWTATAVDAFAHYIIPTEQGDRIAGVTFDVFGLVGVSITLKVSASSVANLDANMSGSVLVAGSFALVAGWQRLLITPTTANAFTPIIVNDVTIITGIVEVNTHVGIKIAGWRGIKSRLP